MEEVGKKNTSSGGNGSLGEWRVGEKNERTSAWKKAVG